MASIGEILEEVDALRMRIGITNAQHFPTSDEWGHARMMAALLIQNPNDWVVRLQEDLADEETRAEVLRMLRAHSKSQYARISQGTSPNGARV